MSPKKLSNWGKTDRMLARIFAEPCKHFKTGRHKPVWRRSDGLGGVCYCAASVWRAHKKSSHWYGAPRKRQRTPSTLSPKSEDK